MTENTFLYTVPQWIIFAVIFVIAYGWIEDKKPFRIIGLLLFFLFGVFSVYILTGDYFAASQYLTPEEIMSEEIDEEIIDEIPFQAKLFPAYLSFALSGLLALPSLYFEFKNKKLGKFFIVLTGLISLFGFFVIVGALRTY
jgi:hypothetical protein